MTLVIGNGPYLSASSFGEGLSVSKSLELIQTLSPSLSGGES